MYGMMIPLAVHQKSVIDFDDEEDLPIFSYIMREWFDFLLLHNNLKKNHNKNVIKYNLNFMYKIYFMGIAYSHITLLGSIKNLALTKNLTITNFPHTA